MKETVKIEYRKLKRLSTTDFQKVKNKWLFRLYDNKYERDKLNINFNNPELEALIRIIKANE